MKFSGDGLVWHPGKGKIVAEFVGGEYETDDPEMINFLTPMYKKNEQAAPPEDPPAVEAPKRGRPKNAGRD